MNKDWCINMAKLEGDTEIGAGILIGPKEKIIAFLRQGGEYFSGIWHSWDSEMAGYADGFADMIENGRHQSAVPENINKYVDSKLDDINVEREECVQILERMRPLEIYKHKWSEQNIFLDAILVLAIELIRERKSDDPN